MNSKKFLRLFVHITSVVLLSCTAACAGPLRLLVPGGPESAFGVMTFSETDIDSQRPARLVREDRGRLGFTREIESVVNQKKLDRMLALSTATKSRVELFTPINTNRKYRSAYAGDRYKSYMKFFTNDTSARNTYIYNKGDGSSNAFAQQFGDFTLGYFKNFSRNNGTGYSEEVVRKIQFLDTGMQMTTSVKQRKEGFQIEMRVADRARIGWLESTEHVNATVNFTDAEDDYMIPAGIDGDHKEISVEYDFSPRYSVETFFTSGDYDSLDDIMYNSTLDIGTWLSEAEYDVKAFYLKKHMSPSRTRTFGFQDYNAYVKMAGTANLSGSLPGYLIGDYVYRSHGLMHRRTFSFSDQRKKGNWTYRLLYSYSTGDAFLHFDSFKRVLIAQQLVNENRYYDYSQHLLGLGIEKEISHDAVLRYSLFQVVPNMDRREEEAAPAPGETTEPDVKKDTRGGTLHMLSAVFFF